MGALFLKIKNWQLIILILIPVLFQIIYTTFNPTGEVQGFIRRLEVFGVIGIICAIWQISIANNFSKKIDHYSTFKKRVFNLFASFGLVYISLCVIYFLLSDIDILQSFLNYVEVFIFNPVSLLLFLFSFIHTTYQNAKIIKTIELKTPVSFPDCIGVFFSFCIFPLGIWLIQPRINRIYDMKEEDDLINHLIE